MTDWQIEIGDVLLKYLAANGGKANKDQYPSYLIDAGYNKKEWLQVLELLLYLRLIEKFGQDDYRIRLTAKGVKASVNLKRYLDRPGRIKKLKMFLLIFGALIMLLTFLFSVFFNKNN
jgi:hypothetical protein